MAWKTQNIEVTLQRRLKKKFKHAPSDAEKYFGYYTFARDMLISEQIFDSIKILKKDLSDHGQDHVMNVLSNAEKLLGNIVNEIDAIELYFICIAILFHDVGNLISNRASHHHLNIIMEVYDHIRNYKRNISSEFDEERILIPLVASKHSGFAGDGSTDTIKELVEETPFLFQSRLNIRKTAALLRLADEMAEGHHRTSTYMNKYYDYPYNKTSKIFHKYAEITKPFIDREGNRIGLTYNFTIKSKNGRISERSHKEFIDLYSFTIQRILKVEAERKYCKYYCQWLAPFNRTDVTFNFIIEDETRGRVVSKLVDLDNSRLILNDLTLPIGESSEVFLSNKTMYTPENMFNSINIALKK